MRLILCSILASVKIGSSSHVLRRTRTPVLINISSPLELWGQQGFLNPCWPQSYFSKVNSKEFDSDKNKSLRKRKFLKPQRSARLLAPPLLFLIELSPALPRCSWIFPPLRVSVVGVELVWPLTLRWLSQNVPLSRKQTLTDEEHLFFRILIFVDKIFLNKMFTFKKKISNINWLLTLCTLVTHGDCAMFTILVVNLFTSIKTRFVAPYLIPLSRPSMY